MYPPNLAFLIEDLIRLGRPPADWLLEAVRDGTVSGEAFRVQVGVRPASPHFDRPGEYWLPVPDWQPYDVSNLARVRSYHTGPPQYFSDTPVCCLRKRQVPGLDENGVVLCWQGRKESVTPESLARGAFGPLWQPPHPKRPALDPDPPGEVWRRVPGWPAYEVSPTGLVRSYHAAKASVAAKPQRLLRPVQDPEIGPSVTLCDGYGGRITIGVAELVRLVYPELATEASGDSSPVAAGDEVGDGPHLSTTAGSDTRARRSGPAEEIIARIERHLGVKSS